MLYERMSEQLVHLGERDPPLRWSPSSPNQAPKPAHQIGTQSRTISLQQRLHNVGSFHVAAKGRKKTSVHQHCKRKHFWKKDDKQKQEQCILTICLTAIKQLIAT
jgi:hypothetical protein